MSFNYLVQKYKLKNKATSNMKIQQFLCSFGLNILGLYLGDGPFESDIRIVNLHPSKGTHWFVSINEKRFDSYGCSPPQNLSKFIIKRRIHCSYPEYKKQGITTKSDSYCGSNCSYKIYLT